MTSHVWLNAHFRIVRPKVVGALMREFADLDLAEDAFATACANAVRNWPDAGLPDNPLAWLLTAGRNAGRDALRRRAYQARMSDGLAVLGPTHAGLDEPPDPDEIRDDVLRLLFICCHPDLSAQDQCALALKVVAGLSVGQIARAFVVGDRAMEQRLTRAKRTIAAGDLAFETPSPAERGQRLNTVLLMIYLMFNEGWSSSISSHREGQSLCKEAIRLAGMLLDLFPSMPELMGLLALFQYQYARQAARYDGKRLLTLEEQDRSLWDKDKIAEASVLLEKALRHAQAGVYQIQAAIAAVHAQATSANDTDLEELERLYSALVKLEPTPVVRLNHAVVVAQLSGPQAGLELLEPLSADLAGYRWFHTARAGLFMEICNWVEARDALAHALPLATTEAERSAIAQNLARCEEKSGSLSD